MRSVSAIGNGSERMVPGITAAPEETSSYSTRSKFENGTVRLLAVGAAAQYLGVSRATVERLASRGELAIVKVGGSTRYDVMDLDAYVETNRRRNRKRIA